MIGSKPASEIIQMDCKSSFYYPPVAAELFR